MGQTLTHGVYLPDEGERNCYNGLAGNWQLLDGSVGTIAAHTTALAGKAPLVHTHTKADITDLFNSANVWTTYNTFTGNQRPIRVRGSDNDIYNVQPQSAAESQIAFVDKNNITMSYIAFQHRADATETHRLCLRQQRITDNIYYSVALNNLGNFYPENNNAINLGTSANKWKTLNGVDPGALSLPDVSDGDPINTNGWSLTGVRNSYTPTENGWFFIRVEGTGVCKLNIHLGSPDNNYPTWNNWNQDSYTTLTVPAVQGVKLYIYITADLIKYCVFYPCLGNV